MADSNALVPDGCLPHRTLLIIKVLQHEIFILLVHNLQYNE